MAAGDVGRRQGRGSGAGQAPRRAAGCWGTRTSSPGSCGAAPALSEPPQASPAPLQMQHTGEAPRAGPAGVGEWLQLPRGTGAGGSIPLRQESTPQPHTRTRLSDLSLCCSSHREILLSRQIAELNKDPRPPALRMRAPWPAGCPRRPGAALRPGPSEGSAGRRRPWDPAPTLCGHRARMGLCGEPRGHAKPHKG